MDWKDIYNLMKSNLLTKQQCKKFKLAPNQSSKLLSDIKNRDELNEFVKTDI